jgi:DNA-binding transcriptional regulator YdaS (Cro superfamily)
MNLRDYLHFRRKTIKDFALSIDMTPGHIYGYIRGRLRVSKKVAKNIEKATQGEVTAVEIMKDNPIKKKVYKK